MMADIRVVAFLFLTLFGSIIAFPNAEEIDDSTPKLSEESTENPIPVNVKAIVDDAATVIEGVAKDDYTFVPKVGTDVLLNYNKYLTKPLDTGMGRPRTFKGIANAIRSRSGPWSLFRP